MVQISMGQSQLHIYRRDSKIKLKFHISYIIYKYPIKSKKQISTSANSFHKTSLPMKMSLVFADFSCCIRTLRN